MLATLERQFEEVFVQFGRGREALLPCLKRAQQEFHCIPREVIAWLSGQLAISPMDIYGAISFYGMLTTRHQGRFVVRVCNSLPCRLNRARRLCGAAEQALGILPGETTADGQFSLDEVGCLGMCDRAPAMLINDRCYGPLTPSKLTEILSDLPREEVP